ncbi:MAG TPA: ribosome maturation factor RimM [Gammaproteobacteria bacterium]|nr:ribosome maturation factor RimM [Gammaproteobacteria bacterium]
MSKAPQALVTVGEVSGLYGVRGWVRVRSYTDPREAILAFDPWLLRCGEHWETVRVADGRRQGKGLVARLESCTGRDAAAAWLGAPIAVRRSQLPEPAGDEYYWTDLEGLRVRTRDGQVLGVIERLFETGANDVMVVRGERERLIPFIRDTVVTAIDLDCGEMEVDWDPDF